MDTSGIMFTSPEVNAGKLEEAMDIDETIYERINRACGTSYQLRRER